MPKKRTQLTIALVAILVAVLAGVVAYVGLTSKLNPVMVLEATTQVPPMTRIAPGDLASVSVPRGRLTQVQYLAGALAPRLVGHYTEYGLYPGEMVVAADIAAATPQTSTYDARLMALRQQAKAAVSKAQATLRQDHIAVPTGGSASFAPAVPVAKGTAGKAGAPVSKAAAAKAKADLAAKAAYTAAVLHQQTVSRDLAVTLQISEQQGFALVHPGDRVTVFGTVHNSAKTTVAFAVGDRVLVLGRQGSAAGAAVHGAVSGLLVLALTPPEVERLMLSQQAGSLLVALNPIGGHALTIGTVTSTELLGAGHRAKTTATQTVSSATAPGAVVPTQTVP